MVLVFRHAYFHASTQNPRALHRPWSYVNNGTPFLPVGLLPFHHKIIDIYDIYEDGI